jgi:hypothetical protein
MLPLETNSCFFHDKEKAHLISFILQQHLLSLLCIPPVVSVWHVVDRQRDTRKTATTVGDPSAINDLSPDSQPFVLIDQSA